MSGVGGGKVEPGRGLSREAPLRRSGRRLPRPGALGRFACPWPRDCGASTDTWEREERQEPARRRGACSLGRAGPR